MQSCKEHIIHERSNLIKIVDKSVTTKAKLSEYDLKQNFFDPIKNSPPNDFLLKIQRRMSVYNDCTSLAKPLKR